MKHLRYLRYLLRHKWFVFVECCRLGIPLRGLLHDWHKFLPSEWFAYADYFYGPKAWRDDEAGKEYHSDEVVAAFNLAWLKHQKRGRHHWQWWVLHEDSGKTLVLPMPLRDRKELLADWKGAGRAMGKPDTLAWYLKNRENMMIHSDAQMWIETALIMSPQERRTER